MKKISRYIKRTAYIASAMVMSLGSLLALVPQQASALQAQSRSIQLSTSSNAASAATTSYNVNFNVASAYAASSFKGIVVQFCSNSPIIGDTTCTAPAGFSTAAVTATTSGSIGTTGWTTAAFITNTAVNLTNATGVTLSAGNTVTFVLANIQNPTALGTFYARIYTYDSTTGATGYTIADPEVGAGNAHTDDGGVALSTANQLTITAKVQETLTFCIYTTGSACSGSSIAGIPVGDANGVLSVYNAAYVAATLAKVGLASNATTGVTVRAKGATLTSGANTIAATGAGGGTCTADSTTTSVEQYGFRVSVAGANQTADAGYACAANSHSFDTTNLSTTYGDSVLTTAGPQDESTSSLEFAAKAATTTKSGVYTSTMTFIATGVY